MILLLSTILLSFASLGHAQSFQQSWPLPAAEDTLWDKRFAAPGINSYHHGSAVMVANDKYLYVGGSFPNIGPHRTRGLMRWDGARWEDLSQGFTRRRSDDGGAYDIFFHALALDSSGNLYVFANVDSIDGKPVGRVARFDGSEWHDYSKGLPREIFSPFILETRGNDLLLTAAHINGYVGINSGDGWRALPPVRDVESERARVLKQRAEAAARRRTEASRRSNDSYDDAYPQVIPIQPEESDDAEIHPRIEMDLTVAGRDVYVQSNFKRADSAVLLQLRDSAWQPVSMDGRLIHGKLYGHRDSLYALLYRPDDGKSAYPAVFDGTTWRPLHSTMLFGFYRLFHLYGHLMATGSTGKGWGTAGSFARWDGSDWQVLTKSEIGGYETKAFAASGGKIFSHIGFMDTARWYRSNLIEFTLDPAERSKLTVRELENSPTLGLSGHLSGIAKYKSEIVVVGNIHQAGDTPVDHIAAWSDSTATWRNLGASLFATRKKNHYSLSQVATDGKYLYVGGYVVSYPGLGSHVFRFDGKQWDSLGRRGFSAGEGRGHIRELCVTTNGTLYSGGNFDAVEGKHASSIAMYDGKSWKALDGGLYWRDNTDHGESADVSSIVELNGQLYVAGNFQYAGKAKPVKASGIARWDGKRWHAIGDSLIGHTTKLFVHDGDLYMAGQFYQHKLHYPPVYSVARWTGTRWEYELLADGQMREASDIFSIDGDLFVVRREEDRHGRGYFSWLYKRANGEWKSVIDRILDGPSTYLPDGENLYANPSLFGGKHISQGFGIMKLPR